MDHIDEEILNYCRNEFVNNDEFQFSINDVLRTVSRKVPNEPGVYLVFSYKNDLKKLVYIGKSGTLNNSGEFSDQKLFKRLNNKANKKESREEYFKNQIIKYELEYLTFYWFVTYNENTKMLPTFVEATLLQKYLELWDYQKLPEWNKEL